MTILEALNTIPCLLDLEGDEGPTPSIKRPCPGCQQRPCTGAHLRCDIARFCVDRGEAVPLP